MCATVMVQLTLISSNLRGPPKYVSRGLLLSMPTMYSIKGAGDLVVFLSCC